MILLPNGIIRKAVIFTQNPLRFLEDSRRWPESQTLPIQDRSNDEPLVWYEGAGTGDRRWLHADTQNSVIGYSDSSGHSQATYAYDPYGLPDTWSATASRYRYTGQTVISEAHLYDYKARMYDPTAGRFLQTDPVGYDSDINLYAYAGNDPVNGWDPSGTTPDECLGCRISVIGGTAPGGLIAVPFTDSGGGVDLIDPSSYYFDPADPDASGVGAVDGTVWGGEIGGSLSFSGWGGNQGGWAGVAGGGGGGKGNGCQAPSGLAGPTTNSIGELALFIGYGLGQILGTHPSLTGTGSVIRLNNSPLAVGGRSFTIGNFEQIASGVGSNTSSPGYGSDPQNNVYMHEDQHVNQSIVLQDGVIGTELIGSTLGEHNPLEHNADMRSARCGRR